MAGKGTVLVVITSDQDKRLWLCGALRDCGWRTTRDEGGDIVWNLALVEVCGEVDNYDPLATARRLAASGPVVALKCHFCEPYLFFERRWTLNEPYWKGKVSDDDTIGDISLALEEALQKAAVATAAS